MKKTMTTTFLIWDPMTLIVTYAMASYVYIGLRKSQKEYAKDPVKYLSLREEKDLTIKIANSNAFLVGFAVSMISLAITGIYGLITVALYSLTAYLWKKQSDKEDFKQAKLEAEAKND